MRRRARGPGRRPPPAFPSARADVPGRRATGPGAGPSQAAFTEDRSGCAPVAAPGPLVQTCPMTRSAPTTVRFLLLLAAALPLAGCGFHLRDRLALPEETPPVRVVSTTPYSELVTILERSLRNAGVEVAEDEVRRDVPGSVARLEILSERWGDLPIAVDERGRAQEFSLRYATVFAFRLADGTELVPQQSVELARDYVSPPVNATGTSTEREILADELRREMAASILRRVDSVVRAGVAHRPGEGAQPAPAD